MKDPCTKPKGGRVEVGGGEGGGGKVETTMFEQP